MSKNKTPLLDWKPLYPKKNDCFFINFDIYTLFVNKAKKEWKWRVNIKGTDLIFNSAKSLIDGQLKSESWLEDKMEKLKEQYEKLQKYFICDNCGKRKPIEEKNLDEYCPEDLNQCESWCDKCLETGGGEDEAN